MSTMQQRRALRPGFLERRPRLGTVMTLTILIGLGVLVGWAVGHGLSWLVETLISAINAGT